MTLVSAGERKQRTWWAVPAGTRRSVCSRGPRWSPVWAASLILSGARPPSTSSSARSGPARASRTPAPAAPAAPSAGRAEEDTERVLLNTVSSRGAPRYISAAIISELLFQRCAIWHYRVFCKKQTKHPYRVHRYLILLQLLLLQMHTKLCISCLL